MKKIDLGILDNADDDIIEKLPLFSSDEETRKRVLSMSEKKFDELINEENKGNEGGYEVSVSGVEKYRRPVWHKALGIAAAIALIAGGVGTAAALKHNSPKSSDSMLAAHTTEHQLTSSSETSSVSTEPPVQALVPKIDIANDEVRFMAAAYAPYLLDISAEQQQKLAAALDSSEWTSCDADETLIDGEAYTMYVYNNGASYSITLYGNNTVKFEYESTKTPWNCIPADSATPIGTTSYWYVPAETAKAITEAANPAAYENALSGHLTWCDISSINVEDIWKNTRAGAKECDMSVREDIFYKMNNTLDYFDRASGYVTKGIISKNGNDTSTCYDFQVDLNTGAAYQHEENYYGCRYDHIQKGSEKPVSSGPSYTYWQDGECSYSMTDSENSYYKIEGITHRIDSPAVPLEELRPKDDTLTQYDNWNTRRQMLGGIAVDCIENYRMAVDYLQDYSKWTITGSEKIIGRVCVCIKGVYDVEYDDVKSFELYVDRETGVTVKALGYDANGELIRYMTVENLHFNDEAEPVTRPDLTGLTCKTLSDPLIIETDNGTKVVVDTSSDDEISQAENQEVGPVIEIPAEAKG